ncbi:MAG TPA: histidine kinase [Gallionellaceae bacterium]|nr:histidine kinase [Gallionellaceae bacterium]
MQILYKFTDRSLLLRLGIAMATITLLGIIGMASSIIIAGMTQGSAATIDVAGSLRMQSYRMASLILVAQRQGTPRSWDAVEKAINTFEQALQSPGLRSSNIPYSTNPADNEYRAIANEWEQQLKPRLTAMALNGRHNVETQTVQQDLALLDTISGFVARVDGLVKLLAKQADNRITLLTTILAISLYITLGVVFFTMYVMHADVLLPLRDLLTCAESAGKGDFSVRAQHTGEDELGRLGDAFNAMAEDLSKLYRNLESRVAEKTADLERSNRSLELLYHSMSRLYDAPIARETYIVLLKDIENVLGIGHGLTCLVGNEHDHALVLASTLEPERGDVDVCSLSDCSECLHGKSLHVRHLDGGVEHSMLTIPLRDMEQQYGVMQLELPAGKALEDWQTQLLEALSRHIGIAIGTAHRVEQNRRLALFEERGVIARELHDSLAQSLSYMKIQVSRLQSILARQSRDEEANKVLTELREGLNSAYRELRELLTTFRLKIEGDGLVPTLEKIAQEFSMRSGVEISVVSRLSGIRLSSNEEIHVMQIVREALANVTHHAKARHAWVTLDPEGDGDVSVAIEDDGIGLTRKMPEAHHYGMAIMLERANTLNGTLQAQTRAVGGARVVLRFRPSNQNFPTTLLHVVPTT